MEQKTLFIFNISNRSFFLYFIEKAKSKLLSDTTISWYNLKFT